MARTTMLITGATGNTGAYTVPLLLDRGHTVRAFVHRQDARADRLAKLGAQIVVGDMLDLEAVSTALQGVTAAYLCYPIEPGLLEATAYFAQGARDAGVSAIVNMSQISARRDAVSNAARQHWMAERLLDWSGIPTTHLRPTFFAEWLLAMAPMIAAQGVMQLPFENQRHAPVAAEDQAHVIAAILDDPAAHAGKTYPLFGPVELSQAEIATEVAHTLGRAVEYQPIAIEQFAAFLAQNGRSAYLIQHLESVALDYRAGRFAGCNDIVPRIGGVPGMTVAAFVDQHRAAFAVSIERGTA